MENITLIEWLFIIVCLFLVDLLQIFIDFATLGFGYIINLPLDAMIWIFFYGYLWMRGVKLRGGKRVGGMVAVGVISMIPIVGNLILPWTLCAIYNMVLSYSGKKAT